MTMECFWMVAVSEHLKRGYLQVQLWLGNDRRTLRPITMSQLPAPEYLFKFNFCTCTTECAAACGCRKHGSVACLEFCGDIFNNTAITFLYNQPFFIRLIHYYKISVLHFASLFLCLKFPSSICTLQSNKQKMILFSIEIIAVTLD